ncbi:hypothetical protein BJX65DRAFT_280392 [Aspergillus insuetus]
MLYDSRRKSAMELRGKTSRGLQLYKSFDPTMCPTLVFDRRMFAYGHRFTAETNQAFPKVQSFDR